MQVCRRPFLGQLPGADALPGWPHSRCCTELKHVSVFYWWPDSFLGSSSAHSCCCKKTPSSNNCKRLLEPGWPNAGCSMLLGGAGGKVGKGKETGSWSACSRRLSAESRGESELVGNLNPFSATMPGHAGACMPGSWLVGHAEGACMARKGKVNMGQQGKPKMQERRQRLRHGQGAINVPHMPGC